MTTRPKVRKIRGRRVYTPEPQWFAPTTDDLPTGGWMVFRQRPEQHAYLLRFNGENIGFLLRFTDGWRWQTTWSPNHGPQRGRISKATYATWQAAASRLVRTDVGRLVCDRRLPPHAKAWRPAMDVRGEPWEPKPAEPEETR